MHDCNGSQGKVVHAHLKMCVAWGCCQKTVIDEEMMKIAVCSM